MYSCLFDAADRWQSVLQVCQEDYMLAGTRQPIHSPHPPPPSPVFQMSPATQQMQPTQTLQSPPPSGGRRRRVVDEDPDERRRKFLERNRAAATRCRQKRKVWVMSLEKKAEELTQTNMQLQVHGALPPFKTVMALQMSKFTHSSQQPLCIYDSLPYEGQQDIISCNAFQ